MLDFKDLLVGHGGLRQAALARYGISVSRRRKRQLHIDHALVP